MLTQTEETFLIGCLVELINFEKDVEILKINITLKPDFNLMDAYSVLDRDCRSEISPSELQKELIAMSLGLCEDDLKLIYARYGEN